MKITQPLATGTPGHPRYPLPAGFPIYKPAELMSALRAQQARAQRQKQRLERVHLWLARQHYFDAGEQHWRALGTLSTYSGGVLPTPTAAALEVESEEEKVESVEEGPAVLQPPSPRASSRWSPMFCGTCKRCVKPVFVGPLGLFDVVQAAERSSSSSSSPKMQKKQPLFTPSPSSNPSLSLPIAEKLETVESWLREVVVEADVLPDGDVLSQVYEPLPQLIEPVDMESVSMVLVIEGEEAAQEFDEEWMFV